MFTSYPTYPHYRALHRTSPATRGEDVYALQTALAELGFDPQGLDGILGDNSAAAIRAFQSKHTTAPYYLKVDAVAGQLTQRALALECATFDDAAYRLPVGLLKGQIEHESSFWLGNYSVQYTDGSFDAGVAQRNTDITPANEGFKVPQSISVLAGNTRRHFDLFEGVKDTRRRWALAQGAWNAPAFACYIARAEGATKVTGSMTRQPSDSDRAKLEAYIQSVSVYLEV